MPGKNRKINAEAQRRRRFELINAVIELGF
jgi:hypothetical protein